MPNADSGTAGPARIPDASDGHRPRPAFTEYETDLPSGLAFAPREVPLEIRKTADEHARAICARLGLDSGDRITRHDGLKDHVLLSTEDGRPLRLALPVALLVEEEPAQPS